jgi:hypothetical protein
MVIGKPVRLLHYHIPAKGKSTSLFNAVADQLNYLRIAPHVNPTPYPYVEDNLFFHQQTYQTIRHAAATYMSTHPDEFLPFLPPEEIEGTERDGVLSPGTVTYFPNFTTS